MSIDEPTIPPPDEEFLDPSLPSDPLLPPHSLEEQKRYITISKFNYSMNLLNDKISALYKLCRHISDQQQENKKSLGKLVTFDELSDEFWNVSYLTYSF